VTDSSLAERRGSPLAYACGNYRNKQKRFNSPCNGGYFNSGVMAVIPGKEIAGAGADTTTTTSTTLKDLYNQSIEILANPSWNDTEEKLLNILFCNNSERVENFKKYHADNTSSNTNTSKINTAIHCSTAATDLQDKLGTDYPFDDMGWNSLPLQYNLQKRSYSKEVGNMQLWNDVLLGKSNGYTSTKEKQADMVEKGAQVIHYVGGKPWMSAKELNALDWEDGKGKGEAGIVGKRYGKLFDFWKNIVSGKIKYIGDGESVIADYLGSE